MDKISSPSVALTLIRFVWRKSRVVCHVYALSTNRRRAQAQAKLDGVDLHVGEGTAFHVRLSVAGSGRINIGSNVSLGSAPARMLGGSGVQLYASSQDSLVSIGKRTFINQDTAIVATTRVEIGEDCLIGDQVSILDTDFHAVSPAERHTSPGESAPIRIGNNVWLAARVMKGVTIGDNTVVAAGAVVTSSLPANVLAGGVPAKVIRAI